MINRARGIAVGLALVASLATFAVPTAAQAAPASAWDESSALAAAREQGTRVQVDSKTSETSQVFANPDGTFTLEESFQPQRVRDGLAGWRPVDASLREVDGLLRATATVHEIGFSNGGDAPLASLDDDGKRITVTWPGTLPEPTVEGSTATYREVFPEVDLKLTATATGFAQVLVVKTREAAANPALKTLRLGLDADGLTIKENAASGLEATDESGRRVFTSPTPTMWDSSSSPGPATRAMSSELTVPEAKQAPMDVQLGAGTVTLTPDSTMLEASDTVYPVYIDPSWSGWMRNWTSAWAAYPDTSYWNASTINWDDDANGVARAGYESQTGMTVRSFFEMDLAGVMQAQVLSATMRITQTHNWSCSATPVDLLQTGPISPATTWNNQPWLSLVTTAWTDLGNSGCGKADGDVEFDLTSVIQTYANNGWNGIGLALKAPDEGNTNQWKRFRANPALAITYNRIPGAPTDLKVAGRGPTNPRPVIGSQNPVLEGRVHDSDGDTNLTTAFGLYKLNPTDSTWSLTESGSQSNLREGDIARHTVTTTLQDKGIYRFHMQTWDAHGAGPLSEWLEFEVDASPPQNAPKVSSSDYGSDLNQIYGSIGKTGDFTFEANGETDIVGYRWGWSDPPNNSVAAPSPGASVTVPITPPPPDKTNPTWGGLMRLFVQSFDAGSRTSPMTEYRFQIDNASAPEGDWRLDDPSGSASAADSSGNGRDATISGATPGAPGRLPEGPTATAFDGSDSIATTGPVVDTSRSFTVSALVKADALTDWHTVVSANGAKHSAFFLRTDSGRWVFSVTPDANQTAYPHDLRGTSAVKTGAWTHVAGVYDSAAKEIRLYVNGALEGTMPVNGVFTADGPVTMGLGRWDGAAHGFWNGSMADVKVWDRVVSAKELEPLSASLLGRWALDGDGSDSTGLGGDTTDSGGVSWTADRQANPDSAAHFDGTGSLTAGGPIVNPSQSFEVSAWTRLDAVGGGAQTVVGQDNGFGLGYDGTRNRWTFAVNGAETASDRPAAVAQWVHLVGRFDAQGRKVILYVDGLAQSAPATSSGGTSGGALAIGRQFRGDVDDVRAFAGFAADASGANIAQCAPASASSSAPSEWGWSLKAVNDGVRGPVGWASWSSLDTDHTETLELSLPGSQAVNRVDLYPRSDPGYVGDNFPANFTIDIWDGSAWTTVVSRSNYPEPTTGAGQSFTFDTRVASKVRVVGTSLRLMQFAEVEVFRAVHRLADNAIGANLALCGTVSASSSAPIEWGWSPAYANDTQDRGWASWSSTDVDHTEWVEIALPSPEQISRVDLYPRRDSPYVGDNFPANFTIQLWDGSAWVTVVTRTNYPKPTDGTGQSFTFDTRNTSKVRVVGTNLRLMQFAEVEIYGRAA